MTTIQIYPDFYKITGKLNIKTIMKTNDTLNNYIEQYNKDKIHALILDNTFINNKKIKLNGCHKKCSTYTIYSKTKDTINKIYKLGKKLDKKKIQFQPLICYHIELYKLMGIKNYKRRLKYLFILNSHPIGVPQNQKKKYKKIFDLTYRALKEENKFKILDDIIKECKNNMK